MNAITSLFSKPKVAGPSDAEKAAQADATARSAEQRAEADRLAALSTRISSRRAALSFSDKKGTLGG